MTPARIVAGALALIVVGTIVQPDASKRVADLVKTLTGFGVRFLDPAVPAIAAPPKSAKGQGSGGQSLWGSIFDSIPGIGQLNQLGGVLGVSTSATSAAPAPAASSSPAASSLPLPTAGPSTGAINV